VHHPSEDRRIQKTRALLHQALMSLVVEKDYDDIAVQEILDRANVGRSTFYTHYNGKDDLLLSGILDLRETLRAAQRAAAAGAPAYERPIGFSRMMFEHAYEYRAVGKALFSYRSGGVVRQRLHDAIADVVRETCTKELRHGQAGDGELPLDLLVHFLASTFVAIMSWWLEQQNPVPPQTIDELYRALVLPGLERLAPR
jgi:AcrR family transcriptional regulator